jgi:hypothetical protein
MDVDGDGETDSEIQWRVAPPPMDQMGLAVPVQAMAAADA